MRWEIYSDESHSETGRFVSIGAISGDTRTLDVLRSRLSAIIADCGITEVKFAQTKTHSPKLDAARRFLVAAIDTACTDKVRFDILTYDYHDSRHAVRGRNDIANMERMYYHLFSKIARQHSIVRWWVSPDKGTSLGWRGIVDVLNSTSYTRRRDAAQLTLGIWDKTRFQFDGFKLCESDQEPLTQMADLLAGLAAYSMDKAERIKAVHAHNEATAQPSFLDDLENLENPETREAHRNRINLILKFAEDCRSRKLGVSVRTEGFLFTHDPSNPINFWPYKPQHREDKAPLRS